MNKFKIICKTFLHLLDPLLALFALIGSLGVIARRGMSSSGKILSMTRFVFEKCGYLPIQDHYYEPLTFDAIGSKYRDRVAQLLFKGRKDFGFLESIACPEEFNAEYASGAINDSGFRFHNGSFESGDAETLYYFVRGVQA